MKNINRVDFLKRSNKTLEAIIDMLDKLSDIKLADLDQKRTALVIIDMINGFTKEGALKSSRVEEITPAIAKLSALCDQKDIQKVVFADCHTEESPEFMSYPVHCLKGSYESEIVDEIKSIGGYELIEKNSTNGFLEEKFHMWLDKNKQLDTFVLTGDCTDICVLQFALTLKTWFNMKNIKARVIVPIDLVETYDLGMHDAELMNVMALYNMIINGIEVVKTINAI